MSATRQKGTRTAESASRIIVRSVVLAVTLAACRCNVGNGPGAVAGAGPWMPIAKSGAEVWTIADTTYSVAATYYLPLPDGLQFTVDYQVPGNFTFDGITDEAAFRVALPLMKHALTGKIYERTVVRDGKGKAVRVEKIGVALFARGGVGTRGYRVARSLSELQKMVDAESPR